MDIETKDEIVRKVLKKMDKRSLVGQRKYGGTMNDEIERREKRYLSFHGRCTRRTNGCVTIFRSS